MYNIYKQMWHLPQIKDLTWIKNTPQHFIFTEMARKKCSRNTI